MEADTERERHLIVKALVYAMEAMNYVRVDLAEPQDKEDMRRLLDAMAPDFVDLWRLKLDAQRRFAC